MLHAEFKIISSDVPLLTPFQKKVLGFPHIHPYPLSYPICYLSFPPMNKQPLLIVHLLILILYKTNPESKDFGLFIARSPAPESTAGI